MSIATDADVMNRLAMSGLTVPSTFQSVITDLRLEVERLVKDFVGYEIEYNAGVVEYQPQKMTSTRYDGDNTALGFDLMGGQVIARDTFPQARRQLVLRQLPIRSITKVVDNPGAYNTNPPDFSSGSGLLVNTQYYLDDDGVGPLGAGCVWSGILYRNVGSWGVQPNTIQITYSAGLTADELVNAYPVFRGAVLTACMMAIGEALARAKLAITGVIVGSTSIEDFSVGFVGVNVGLLGTAFGTGIACAALPTVCCQKLANYVHPAKLF